MRLLARIPVLVVVLGVVVMGQGKLTTADDYAKNMKANAQAAGPMNKALASGAFADARMNVATLRENFMALQGFWMDKKKDDAVAIVKDGLSRLDALDKILAAPAPDQICVD